MEAASSWLRKCLTERGDDVHSPEQPPVWSEEDLEGFTEKMLLDLRAAFEHFIEAFNYLKVSLSRSEAPFERGRSYGGRPPSPIQAQGGGSSGGGQGAAGGEPPARKPESRGGRAGEAASPPAARPIRPISGGLMGGDIPAASLRSIHIYDLAGKKNGFMLFRQGHRLIFAPEAPGRIRIQLAKKARGLEEPEKCVDSCLHAVANNVMSLKWVHEKYPGFVDIDALAHYYMKYFLQESGG